MGKSQIEAVARLLDDRELISDAFNGPIVAQNLRKAAEDVIDRPEPWPEAKEVANRLRAVVDCVADVIPTARRGSYRPEQFARTLKAWGDSVEAAARDVERLAKGDLIERPDTGPEAIELAAFLEGFAASWDIGACKPEAAKFRLAAGALRAFAELGKRGKR
jgi:hypothetical protein